MRVSGVVVVETLKFGINLGSTRLESAPTQQSRASHQHIGRLPAITASRVSCLLLFFGEHGVQEDVASLIYTIK